MNPFDKQKGRNTEAVRLARMRELKDIRQILSTPEGRRHFHRLFELTGVYRTVFNTHNGVMSYNEGMRVIGLTFLADIDEACPERIQQISEEGRRNERIEASEREIAEENVNG